MQGSFEKRVQEKMEELKLTPSAPVWEKIELQIKPEKKRRRALLWIPLGLALLIGAGWWTFSHHAEKPFTTPTAANADRADKEKTSEKNPINIEKPVTIEKKKEATTTTTLTPDQKKTIIQTGPEKRNKGQRNIESPFLSIKSNNIIEKGEKKKEDAALVQVQKPKNSIGQLLREKVPNAAIIENTATAEKENVLPLDSVVQTRPPAERKSPVPFVADTNAVKPKVASISNKWKIAITLQAVWGQPSSGLQSSLLWDAYANVPQNSTGGSFAGTPSSVTGRTAFAAGVGLTRPISKRFQVSFGLQYSAFRSRTKVGAFKPMDTALAFRGQSVPVEGYYKNDNKNDYTTRYHVLEFPVSLEYKLLTKLPLSLAAGALYGRLLNSNALTYSSAARIYYYNKENLNHNFLSLFSSLQYKIINKQEINISAGPMVQYQFTRLHKEAGSASPRLFFAGIKTAVNF